MSVRESWVHKQSGDGVVVELRDGVIVRAAVPLEVGDVARCLFAGWRDDDGCNADEILLDELRTRPQDYARRGGQYEA